MTFILALLISPSDFVSATEKASALLCSHNIPISVLRDEKLTRYPQGLTNLEFLRGDTMIIERNGQAIAKVDLESLALSEQSLREKFLKYEFNRAENRFQLRMKDDARFEWFVECRLDSL